MDVITEHSSGVTVFTGNRGAGEGYKGGIGQCITQTLCVAKKLPNLIELAAVTGHKDVRMLARYYHPKAEDLALKLG